MDLGQGAQVVQVPMGILVMVAAEEAAEEDKLVERSMMDRVMVVVEAVPEDAQV